MKLLSQFNPTWLANFRKDSGEGLAFDCPTCGPAHRLAVYFNNPLDHQPAAPFRQKPEGEPGVWKRIGDELDTVSVHPSIQYPCFHGWIMFGVVVDVREASHYGEVVVDGKKQKTPLSPFQVLRAKAMGNV